MQHAGARGADKACGEMQRTGAGGADAARTPGASTWRAGRGHRHGTHAGGIDAARRGRGVGPSRRAGGR